MIGSVNGLAPNRCQAITWSNDDLVHSLIYCAPNIQCVKASLTTGDAWHLQYIPSITQTICTWLVVMCRSSSTFFVRLSLIAEFMGPTWGPHGADRTQVGAMLAPWTLLSGMTGFTGQSGVGYLVYFTIIYIGMASLGQSPLSQWRLLRHWWWHLESHRQMHDRTIWINPNMKKMHAKSMCIFILISCMWAIAVSHMIYCE